MIKTRDLTTKSHSSSVSTPEEVMEMTGIKKFLFDCSFDSKETDASEETIEEIIEEPEEIIPTFTKEELEIARDEGFIKGKEHGIKEAAAAKEQILIDAIKNLETQFANLFKTQQEAAKSDLNNAILVANAISRKIFPSLNKRGALEEVEHMVANVMKEIHEEPKVCIYIHPDLKPLLKEHIDLISKKTNHRGEITIIATDDIPLGDCNIEWDSGGAQRNIETLLEDVEEIVERNLQEVTSKVNSDEKNVETEIKTSKNVEPEETGS
jgi:flagellar biosynthesis/type III secretory pathway protein FliH